MRRTALGALGLLTLLTPLRVLALLIVWVLVAQHMTGRTWLRRATYSLITLFAATATALTLLAVLHRPCDPRWLVAVFLVPAVLIRPHPASRTAFATVSERWGAGFGVVTFVVLYVPFVGATTGRTMALLSQTTDGATHVQLVTAVMRHRGYVQLVHPAGLSPGADTYPTGWHGNVWVLSDLLLGHHPSVGALVRLVAVIAIAGYALMCSLAAECVLDVASGSGSLRPTAALGGLAGLALSAVLGFGIFLVQLGSYTQVFALAVALAVALATTEAADAPTRSLVTLTAAAVALMQSWYLLLPLLVGVACVVVARTRPPARGWLPLALIGLPGCAYPLLTGPTGAHLDMGGSILLPTILGVLGLLAATCTGCVFGLRTSASPVALALVAATVGGLVTLVVLVVRQGYVPGSGLSYYGAKVLLATLLLGSVLASALVARTLSAPGAGRPYGAVAAAVGLGLGTWSTAWVCLPPRAGVYEGHLDPSTLDAIFHDHPRGAPKGTEVWVLSGCDRVGDRVASKWLPDTSLTWTDAFSDALAAYSDDARGDVRAVRDRLSSASVGILELYVHRPCDLAALAQLEGLPKVRVIRVP